MNVKSPLGANYGWVVSKDHHYAPRDLDEDVHNPLAIFAVLNDVELMKIEKVLGYPVILAIKVGKTTLSVRIYNRKDVATRPDRLPSRMASRDTSAFLTFNDTGGLELVEGVLRESAQGHTPTFYADRLLSPQRREQLQAMERQLTSAPMKKLGLPRADKPLQGDEEWTTVVLTDAPSLEPDSDQSR